MPPLNRSSLLLLLGVLAGCPSGAPAGPREAPRSDASAGTPIATVGAAAAKACVPRVSPRGIVALDREGRVLNARGIHLTDWDGFLANPAVSMTLRPPRDVAFPATGTLTANHARLYFDLPSTVGASGPRKVVRFETAESTVQVRLGIFPDRDGADETYALTLAVSGADDRTEIVPVSVHDQDRNLPLVSRILVDFTDDETGFFRDPRARGVVQQAADDWSYFLDDMALDAIPPMDEQTLIWRQDGFVSEKAVRNPNGYSGFLLYAYGIHSDAVRSGGEGSYNGKAQTHTGAVQPLRRSGGLEVETQGNFNTLGWIMDTEPERWWVTANLGREQNDLYSIVHHEMGHAHGFNPAYPLFATARETGLRSPALAAYHGGPLRIDVHDHFDKTVDPDSGFGAFGNEYHGVMPARRWLITRLDLLALEAVGYKVRLPTFEIWRDTVPDCP